MKIFCLCLFLIQSVFAASEEIVSIRMKVNSHHGNPETRTLLITRDNVNFGLVLDGVKLPETKILTNRKDLDAIIQFKSSGSACSREVISFERTIKGEYESLIECVGSKNALNLLNAFGHLSPIQ